MAEARASLEQLVGSSNLERIREARGEMIADESIAPVVLERFDAPIMPDSLGSWEEDDYLLDQPEEPSEVVRERAARRLLEAAVHAWTTGDAAAAQSLCDRIRRHYEPYPSAQQALVLEREMHLSTGNTALAGSLPAYPVLPDTGLVPLAGFLRFLDEHWKQERVDQIERLAETWGPWGGARWRCARGCGTRQETRRAPCLSIASWRGWSRGRTSSAGSRERRIWSSRPDDQKPPWLSTKRSKTPRQATKRLRGRSIKPGTVTLC
jgi:hypothetical protein